LAGSGDPTLREGLAVHLYAANVSMKNKAFVDCDGDLLIVPSQGRLDIQTEFGKCVFSWKFSHWWQRALTWNDDLKVDGASRRDSRHPTRDTVQGRFAVILHCHVMHLLTTNEQVNLPDGPSRGCKFFMACNSALPS